MNKLVKAASVAVEVDREKTDKVSQHLSLMSESKAPFCLTFLA
jgi:hypothetical protein